MVLRRYLAHARIYTMAVKLGVNTLSTLALQRLLRTLINIGSLPPNPNAVSNFSKPVRYTYAHTYTLEDPLRAIVSQFAALNFTAFQAEDINSLMGGQKEFASDLMKKVSGRLTAAERGVDIIMLQAGLKQELALKNLEQEITRLKALCEEYEKTIKMEQKPQRIASEKGAQIMMPQAGFSQASMLKDFEEEIVRLKTQCEGHKEATKKKRKPQGSPQKKNGQGW